MSEKKAADPRLKLLHELAVLLYGTNWKRQLGRDAGINQAMFHYWEKGDRALTDVHIAKIRAAIERKMAAAKEAKALLKDLK